MTDRKTDPFSAFQMLFQGAVCPYCERRAFPDHYGRSGRRFRWCKAGKEARKARKRAEREAGR